MKNGRKKPVLKTGTRSLADVHLPHMETPPVPRQAIRGCGVIGGRSVLPDDLSSGSGFVAREIDILKGDER